MIPVERDRVRKPHQPAGIKPDPTLGLVLRRRVRGLSPPEKGKDVMHVRVRVVIGQQSLVIG
jgi:hypothetical protein